MRVGEVFWGMLRTLAAGALAWLIALCLPMALVREEKITVDELKELIASLDEEKKDL